MSWLLGLTGSIGTGKSTTSQVFRDEGVPVWDADQVVHELYENDRVLIDQIERLFLSSVVDGAVSRASLAEVLRKFPDRLTELETLVHPRLKTHRQNYIADHENPILVFDIPLLFETGTNVEMDSVLVVTCDPAEQKRRVLSRTGMTQEKFEFILSKQLPDSEKRQKADHIIETISIEQVRDKVRNLIRQIEAKQNA